MQIQTSNYIVRRLKNDIIWDLALKYTSVFNTIMFIKGMLLKQQTIYPKSCPFNV